jgi:hypothetical protein
MSTHWAMRTSIDRAKSTQLRRDGLSITLICSCLRLKLWLELGADRFPAVRTLAKDSVEGLA